MTCVLQNIQEYITTLGNKRDFQQVVNRDTLLVGADFPFDSLDLATLVVKLQQQTGKDPFADGFVSFTTAGELADLFS